MAFEPITFGLFTIDASGRIDPSTAENRPEFRFAWRNRPVRAEIGNNLLSLHVMLGRVPSTRLNPAHGGGADEGLRNVVFGTLRLLKDALPPLWRMRLLADHRVELTADAALALPATAASLMVVVTQFLLALAPYLDLLDETGMPARVPTVPASGIRKVWPG